MRLPGSHRGAYPSFRGRWTDASRSSGLLDSGSWPRPRLPTPCGPPATSTPLREGGSLPALVEADDDGLYVVKFRGAGQGPKALVAELVAGEVARALGLARARARASSSSTRRSAQPSPTRRSRT